MQTKIREKIIFDTLNICLQNQIELPRVNGVFACVRLHMHQVDIGKRKPFFQKSSYCTILYLQLELILTDIYIVRIVVIKNGNQLIFGAK